jgi:hypothetical protein
MVSSVRFNLVVLGRVIRERHIYDQQASLIESDLGGIFLLEALSAAVLHDTRLGVGEGVLVLRCSVAQLASQYDAAFEKLRR